MEINPAKAQVLTTADYYPFGSIMRESQLAGISKPRFGYQGDFAEDDEETGWNSFELRMYDGVIGRFTTVDPAGQFFSPYVGMGNNHINMIDPDGAFSKFGAWWRSTIYGLEMGYGEDKGEWFVGGYTKYSGDGAGVA